MLDNPTPNKHDVQGTAFGPAKEDGARQRSSDSMPSAQKDTTISEFDDIPEVIESFDALGLNEELLRGIYSYGYEKPSAIQQRAIKPLMDHRDVIAQAQSGTGKTATFSIGLLHTIDKTNRNCQAIILANTRELANQISKVVQSLAIYLGVTSIACVGGSRLGPDMDKLRAGVQVVIGTPGRVLDMLRRRALRAHDVHFLVLDEADEMIRGFTDQLYDVLQELPASSSIALFSAIMPDEVLALAKQFMREPMRILVKQAEQTLDGIKQFYVMCEQEEHKFDALCDLYQRMSITQAIIFANHRRKVDWLISGMEANDHTVSGLHADMEPGDRVLVMQQFRAGASRVLITTDVLGRGIDVQQVSLVINFDLPTVRENYIHRIGRGGRFGRKGVAINLITHRDVRTLFDIEKFYCTNIVELPQEIENLI